MPDAMDRVQQHAEDLASDALAAHARRPRPVGLTSCENLDCREPIAAARTAMGARLCLDCQREEEGRAAHFDRWRRR
jgi:hypothetical protein